MTDTEPTVEARDRDPRPILVGVDRTESALAATRWAAEAARADGVPLILVHAASYVGAPDGPEAERARSILARAWSEAVRSARGVSARTELVLDRPPVALAALSVHARLVAVGLTGSGEIDELPLGTTAVGLARHAGSPVVGVRRWPLPVDGPREVLVGVRDVVADAAVVGAAFEEAERRGSSVLILHTVPHGEKDTAAAERVVHAALADWRRRHPGVGVRVVAEHGSPGQALLRRSEHAELVVVGQRPRGSVNRALFGSTSRWLLRHSRVPVLVTPRLARAAEPSPTAADQPAMTT